MILTAVTPVKADAGKGIIYGFRERDDKVEKKKADRDNCEKK